MTKVKNVRPGILIIADARMRLEPREVLEVEKLTSHSTILRNYSSYGPRNRSPLKWIKCVGDSATQTSVSQDISSRCFIIVRRSRNAVT